MESIRKVFFKPDEKQLKNDKIHSFLRNLKDQKLITYYHFRHLKLFFNLKRDVLEETKEETFNYINASKDTKAMVELFFQHIEKEEYDTSYNNVQEIMQSECFLKASAIHAQQSDKKPQFDKRIPRNFQKVGGNRDFTHFISLPLITEEVQSIFGQWKETVIVQNYPEISKRLFMGADKIHITILMLPLGEPGQIERAVQAIKSVEQSVKTYISENCKSQSLSVPLQKGLHYFGKPDSTRVLQLRPDTTQIDIEILKTIIHIMVVAMLEHQVLSESELSHVSFNPKSNRYENEQLHITLMNATFGKQRSFDSRNILDNHGQDLNLNSIIPDTIEISTRGAFDERGFYKPVHTINIRK